MSSSTSNKDTPNELTDDYVLDESNVVVTSGEPNNPTASSEEQREKFTFAKDKRTGKRPIRSESETEDPELMEILKYQRAPDEDIDSKEAERRRRIDALTTMLVGDIKKISDVENQALGIKTDTFNVARDLVNGSFSENGAETSTPSSLTAERQDLEKEYEQLKIKHHETKQRKRRLKEKFAKDKDALESQITELSGLLTESKEQLKFQQEQSQAHVDQLKKNIEAYDATLDIRVKEVGDQQKKLKEMEQKEEDDQKKYQTLETLYISLERKAKSAEEANEKKFRELESEKTKLDNQVKTSQTMIDGLKSRLKARTEGSKKNIQGLTAELEILRQQKEQFDAQEESHQQKMTALEKTRTEFEEQKKDLEAKLAAEETRAKNEISSLQRAMEAEKAELSSQIQSSQLTINNLQAQLDTKSKSDNQRIQELTVKLLNLGKQKAALDVQESGYKEKISKLEAEQKTIEGQKEKLEDDLKTEKTRVEKQISLLQQEFETEKTRLGGQIQSSQAMINDLTSRLDANTNISNEEIQRLTVELGTLRQQKEQFDAQEESHRQKMTALEKARLTLEGQKEELEATLAAEKTRAEQQIASLKQKADAEKADLERRISEMEQQIGNDVQTQEMHVVELEKVNREINDLKNTLNDERDIMTFLRSSVENAEESLRDAEDKAEQLRNDLAEAVTVHDKLERRVTKRDNNIAKLKKELELLRKDPRKFAEEREKSELQYEHDSDEEERSEEDIPQEHPLMPSISSAKSSRLMPKSSTLSVQPPVIVNVNTHCPQPSQLRDDEDERKQPQPQQQQHVVSTSTWIRKSDGKILPRSETIDILDFAPKIPEQAERWRQTLSNIARNSDIGNPHRVYEAVEALLKTNHPNESEFFHDFYLLVRTVEGKSGNKKRGQFWIAETEGLRHLSHDIIEAATESIAVVPLKDANFFPLSKEDLANGIAFELQQFKEKPGAESSVASVQQSPMLSSSLRPSSSSSSRDVESESSISDDIQSSQSQRNAWNAQRRRTVHPPRYPLPTPKQLEEGLPELPQGKRPMVLPGRYQDTIEKIHQQELTQRQQEARRSGPGWTPEKKNIASLSQARYQNRYPNAPLRGIDQRIEEYGLTDRLDASLVLFDNENILIITYNFWDFIQQRILGNINKAQPNYVVELQEGADTAWTNVVQGTDFNDIAHYLADHLWKNLQVRHIGGPLTRKPSMLSVKKYLDNQAIGRITDELIQIDQEYVQPWQNRIFSMLQTAVNSTFFAAFREALDVLKIEFNIGEPLFTKALKSMAFASLVAAYYQRTMTNTAQTATGYHLVNSFNNVGYAIDAARDALGLAKITTGPDYTTAVDSSSFLTSLPQQPQRPLKRTSRTVPQQRTSRFVLDLM